MDCCRHSSSNLSASASCFKPDRSSSPNTGILATPPPPFSSMPLLPPPRSPQVPRSLTLPSPPLSQSPRSPASQLLPPPPPSPRTPPGLPSPRSSSPQALSPLLLPSLPLPLSPQAPHSPRSHILLGSNPSLNEAACDNADLRSDRLAVMAERLAVSLQREHAARESVMNATLNWYNEVTRLLLQSASPNSSSLLPLDSSRTLRGQNTSASLASKAIDDTIFSAPYYSFGPTGSSLPSLDSTRSSSSQNTYFSLASKAIDDTLFSAPYYSFFSPTSSSIPSLDSSRSSSSQYTSSSLSSKGADDTLYSVPYYSFNRDRDSQPLSKLPFDLEADGGWKDVDIARLTQTLEDLVLDDDKTHLPHENLLSHMISHRSSKKRTVRFSTD